MKADAKRKNKRRKTHCVCFFYFILTIKRKSPFPPETLKLNNLSLSSTRSETPLTIAAVSARPGPLLLALVGGGALIDYRTRCGSTALHRAAEKNNIEAVRTLLDLGASPNYRDAKALTPLWNAVSCRASPMLCQALLHDYSIHGVQDAQGWHEVHQVFNSFRLFFSFSLKS